VDDRHHGLGNDIVEIVPDEQTAEDINRVVVDIHAEYKGENEIHDEHGDQRVEQAPEHPEHRSFVFRLEVPGNKLFQQEPVFLHLREHLRLP